MIYNKLYFLKKQLTDNFFLSQHNINNVNQLVPLKNFEINLVIKRVKKLSFIKIMPTLFGLLYSTIGNFPSFFKKTKKFIYINFVVKNKKKLLFADLFFFVILLKLRKAKELVKLSFSNKELIITSHNIFNFIAFRGVDQNLLGLSNITTTIKTSSSYYFYYIKNLVNI